MAAPQGFSRLQIRLHWIVFALVALQFILHDGISEAWDRVEDGVPTGFDPLVASHVAGGFAILALALWRLSVRRSRGVPPPPDGKSGPMVSLAHWVHVALYAVMILMPIGGAVAWFGGVEMAAEGHELMKFVLGGLVALHVAGALYNHFVLKNGLLNRMRQAAD